MFKLYPYILAAIIVIFITACGGSTTVKHTGNNNKTKAGAVVINSSLFSSMDSGQKITTAEQLIASAESKKNPEKNALLSNALLLCTQILADYHQAKLSRDHSLTNITPEQYTTARQLLDKINAWIETNSLSFEQKNQYLLMSATLSLTNYQSEETLVQLNQNFNSKLAETGSLYYQLRAMAEFQSGQSERAAKEAIIRHHYLNSPQEKQTNQKIIWNYLAALTINSNTSTITSNSNNNERIYLAWLELAKILRGPDDSQTLTHAINFWLQKYPNHQADRVFINHIIAARRASMLTIHNIAVLLPLQGNLLSYSKPILDGILASHYNAPLSDQLQLRFYDTSQGQPVHAIYQQAVNNGADFIIGPLSKPHVKQLADAGQLERPTLALNSLVQNNPTLNNRALNTQKGIHKQVPEKLYQFALSPEAAAQMVAKKARQDGHYYAAVMTPENTWGKRMNDAFSFHWQSMGGLIVSNKSYEAQQHDFSDIIKNMLNIDQSEARKKEVSHTIGRKVEFTPRRRQDIDMIFMAARPRQAKQIPLQISYHHGHSIPVYATPHIVANYHDKKNNIDMDGVHFFDMPFLLGNTEHSISQNNSYQNALDQRLFAMGVDSYQLAPYVSYLYQNPSESFSGDSGQITIDYNGHIIRNSPWATFDQGHIKLIADDS